MLFYCDRGSLQPKCHAHIDSRILTDAVISLPQLHGAFMMHLLTSFLCTTMALPCKLLAIRCPFKQLAFNSHRCPRYPSTLISAVCFYCSRSNTTHTSVAHRWNYSKMLASYGFPEQVTPFRHKLLKFWWFRIHHEVKLDCSG